MARITGKNGQIKIGGTVVASIFDWTLEAKIPVADATAMRDDYKTKLSLIREWAGTAQARWEPGVNNELFTSTFANATTDGGHQSGKITLDLYPDENSNEKFSGDAFADFDIKVGFDKEVDASIKFTGTGSLIRTAP